MRDKKLEICLDTMVVMSVVGGECNPHKVVSNLYRGMTIFATGVHCADWGELGEELWNSTFGNYVKLTFCLWNLFHVQKSVYDLFYLSSNLI